MVWNAPLYEAVERHNREQSAEEAPPIPEEPKPSAPPEGCCPRYGKPLPRPTRQEASPLGRLFSDKDALLIAGLILVLLNEKADMKLVLALAFVLLG